MTGKYVHKDLEVPRIAPGVLNVEDAYTALQGFLDRGSAWYLAKKGRKRRMARLTRFASIVLGVAGGIIPVGASLWPSIPISLGYVLLALAAGSQLLDRGFGFSAGWMGHLVAAQRLQELSFRLALSYSKAAEEVEDTTSVRWSLLQDSSAEAWKVIGLETDTWSKEFAAATDEISQRAVHTS